MGSSNASINGLALQDNESKRHWLEANIIADDPIFVSSVLSWFDGLWNSP